MTLIPRFIVALAIALAVLDTATAATVVELPAAPGGTLLEALTRHVATSRFSGTARAAVYDGPEPGINIDFYFQFTNDPTSSEEVARVDAGDPLALTATTGLFQTPGPFGIFPAGTRSPSNGSFFPGLPEVDFLFLFGSALLPGETSEILIARTSAQQFLPQITMAVSSPFSSIGSVFAPQPAVPEPYPMTLLLSGLLAVALATLRRPTVRHAS